MLAGSCPLQGAPPVKLPRLPRITPAGLFWTFYLGAIFAGLMWGLYS